MTTTEDVDGEYPVRPHEVIRSGHAHYEVLSFLGKGTFGQVLKCWRQEDGDMVAMKVLRSLPSYAKQGRIEVNTLNQLGPHYADYYSYVKAYESFLHCGHICIVFELLETNLYDYLKGRGFKPLSLEQIRPIIQQVLSCLVRLRELGLVHADLKPENIMLVDNGNSPLRVKVIDFGSTTQPQQLPTTSYLQSRYYRAPEVLLGLPFDMAVDMWSLGCVAAELFLGWPMFPGASEYDQLCYITETCGSIPDRMLQLARKASKFLVRDAQTGQWVLKDHLQVERETGTKMKETRKYIFQSLSELNRILLPGNKDLERGSVGQMDRSEFVSFLSTLLKIDPVSRITPCQALQKPFITMYHLAAHTHLSVVQDGIQMMSVCRQPPQQATPLSHWMPYNMGYNVAPSTLAYFPAAMETTTTPQPPVTMATAPPCLLATHQQLLGHFVSPMTTIQPIQLYQVVGPHPQPTHMLHHLPVSPFARL